MINPSQAWCAQIALTELCWPKASNGQLSACSNCTRGIGHIRKRYIMPLDDVERSFAALADFPIASAPCPQGRTKVVGCFGAEAVLHPQFPEIVDIACSAIPEARHRGLWCSQDFRTYSHPKYGPVLPHVQRLLGWPMDNSRRAGRTGYLNHNLHNESQSCQHQPILVSIGDVVTDERRKWELIEDCWVQREWSPLIGPDYNGDPKWYFCEVAQTHDRLFNLGIGLPVESECWRGDITFIPTPAGHREPVGRYAAQIKACCTRCGAPLPLPGRRDLELIDDISETNLLALGSSPMVSRGDFVEFDPARHPYDEAAHRAGGWKPEQYIKASG